MHNACTYLPSPQTDTGVRLSFVWCFPVVKRFIAHAMHTFFIAVIQPYLTLIRIESTCLSIPWPHGRKVNAAENAGVTVLTASQFSSINVMFSEYRIIVSKKIVTPSLRTTWCLPGASMLGKGKGCMMTNTKNRSWYRVPANYSTLLICNLSKIRWLFIRETNLHDRSRNYVAILCEFTIWRFTNLWRKTFNRPTFVPIGRIISWNTTLTSSYVYAFHVCILFWYEFGMTWETQFRPYSGRAVPTLCEPYSK